MFVFFFQAEDGIRDWSVTGVQTCALPISQLVGRGPGGAQQVEAARLDLARRQQAAHAAAHAAVDPADEGQRAVEFLAPGRLVDHRSEERRVGKEWRCGLWRNQSQELQNGS